jgi:aryl-alcohol dehydrogenase-like predicted oxidoreductase
MDYRSVGRSGLKVSPLCLGTMLFGAQTDAPTSRRIIDRAREARINFIDTADSYNAGQTEELVGAAIRDTRGEWVLATKLGHPMGDGPNDRGLSRGWIFRAAEASLRRLGTDVIDIYYLHKEEHETPLEETVLAMGELMRQGKIRYFGVSNYKSWRVAEICNLCDRFGIARPVASQPYYNAVNRMVETEHLAACGYYGLGVVPYSPVARGVLTGKYALDSAPPANTRASRQDGRIMQTEWRRESLEIAQQLSRHAEARGMTPGQFAVNWVLNNRLITAAVAGPRTEAQWEDYLGALGHRFNATDEAFVDSLVAPGHPSTPGYNDPMYPIEGRVPRTVS